MDTFLRDALSHAINWVLSLFIFVIILSIVSWENPLRNIVWIFIFIIAYFPYILIDSLFFNDPKYAYNTYALLLRFALLYFNRSILYAGNYSRVSYAFSLEILLNVLYGSLLLFAIYIFLIRKKFIQLTG